MAASQVGKNVKFQTIFEFLRLLNLKYRLIMLFQKFYYMNNCNVRKVMGRKVYLYFRSGKYVVEWLGMREDPKPGNFTYEPYSYIILKKGVK